MCKVMEPHFYRATLMNKCHIKEIRTIEFH